MDISESGLCGFSPSLISVCCSPSLFSPPSSNPFIPSGVAKGGVKALRFAGTFFFGPPLQSHRGKHACTVVRLPAKLSTLPPSSYAIFPPQEKPSQLQCSFEDLSQDLSQRYSFLMFQDPSKPKLWGYIPSCPLSALPSSPVLNMRGPNLYNWPRGAESGRSWSTPGNNGPFFWRTPQ